MGSVSLSKNNRLFWLGRYAERVYQGVMIIRTIQDELIDGDKVDMVDLQNRLGMDSAFETVEEFFQRYAYDITLADSIYYAADQMLGNGMVLREVLGSQTLSYLQMAMSALDAAKESHSCGLQLQWVVDDIMAFRGCYGEYIEQETTRNTIRSGASVERVATMIRFGDSEENLKKELHRLVNRLYKTNLPYHKTHLDTINAYIFSKEPLENPNALLSSVEYLFQV